MYTTVQKFGVSKILNVFIHQGSPALASIRDFFQKYIKNILKTSNQKKKFANLNFWTVVHVMLIV